MLMQSIVTASCRPFNFMPAGGFPGIQKEKPMLETELKNNTAALAALAAAVADLTAALRASAPASAPVTPAPAPVVAPAAPVVAPAAPAPAPAPAAMPPVNPVPAAAAPALAPAPAAMPPVNPVPAAAAPAPVAMSGDELRKLCVRAGAAGLTAEVVQFLSDHGVAKLAALPPADYPALVALLKAKGVE